MPIRNSKFTADKEPMKDMFGFAVGIMKYQRTILEQLQ